MSDPHATPDNAAIEAAARTLQRLYEESGDDPTDVRSWDEIEAESPGVQDEWRSWARQALEAAEATRQ